MRFSPLHLKTYRQIRHQAKNFKIYVNDCMVLQVPVDLLLPYHTRQQSQYVLPPWFLPRDCKCSVTDTVKKMSRVAS